MSGSGGINLDPVPAMRAGRMLGEAGERIVRVRETIGAEIEAINEAKPWGGDGIGSMFAKSYADLAPQLLEVWRTAAQRTRQLGGEVETAVEATLAADEAAAQRVSQAGGLAPA